MPETRPPWHTYWISFSHVAQGVIGFGGTPYGSAGPITPDLILGDVTDVLKARGLEGIVIMSVSLLSVEGEGDRSC
jgi:hypothetical protein